MGARVAGMWSSGCGQNLNQKTTVRIKMSKFLWLGAFTEMPHREGGQSRWSVVALIRVRVDRNAIRRGGSVMKIKPVLEGANRNLTSKRAGLAPKIASIPRAHDGPLGGIGRLCRFLMM